MTISNFIYSWIKDLVLLFIIISLVDLIMPKGSLRRYINFVIGLLIIFTVINPFIKLTSLDFQLDREVFRNIDNAQSLDEDIVARQDEQIESLYKEKIANEIKTFVEDNTEYSLSTLNVEINKAEDNFATIAYLNMIIQDENVGTNDDNIRIEVKPVILEANVKNHSEDDFSDIKELISKRYEIEEELISINKAEE